MRSLGISSSRGSVSDAVLLSTESSEELLCSSVSEDFSGEVFGAAEELLWFQSRVARSRSSCSSIERSCKRRRPPISCRSSASTPGSYFPGFFSRSSKRTAGSPSNEAKRPCLGEDAGEARGVSASSNNVGNRGGRSGCNRMSVARAEARDVVGDPLPADFIERLFDIPHVSQ